MATQPRLTSGLLKRAVLLAALALSACSGTTGAALPTPLSNVTPRMLSPDGTFKKNGLVPVDPSEQI